MAVFRSLTEVKKLFRNPNQCVQHFIQIHRRGIIECPKCQSEEVIVNSESLYIKSNIYRCGDCNNKFSIFHGTFLDKSNIDLRIWLYAFDQFLFVNNVKAVSAYQVQRALSLPYSTASKMSDYLNEVIKNPSYFALAKSLFNFGYLQEE